MTVENAHHRIQELKGRLMNDVNFGWGLLGKLEKGGSFSVERKEIGPGIWDITSTHVHIQGHALIFKSISEQEDDEKSSFSRQPDNISLEQAASAVMAKPGEGRELSSNALGRFSAERSYAARLLLRVRAAFWASRFNPSLPLVFTAFSAASCLSSAVLDFAAFSGKGPFRVSMSASPCSVIPEAPACLILVSL